MPLIHYVFSDSVNRYYEHKELKKLYKGIVGGVDNQEGGAYSQEDILLREIQQEEAEYFNHDDDEDDEG